MISRREHLALLREGLARIRGDTYAERRKVGDLLYLPRPELRSELNRLDELLDGDDGAYDESRSTLVGRQLERIAFLAFGSLLGACDIRNFTSFGPQYDLLVDGLDDEDWLTLCATLRMKPNTGTIVVEAKAWHKRVDDNVFSRVCAILQQNFAKAGGLGVLMTIHGATGFPTAKQPKKPSLHAARLRQYLFYCRTDVPVVVMERQHMDLLCEPGGLVKFLLAAIREIELGSGLSLPTAPVTHLTEVPDFLEDLAKLLQGDSQI